MENNLGKICPLCKQQIMYIENIAICNECGTAYHKSCWTNNDGCIICQEKNRNKMPIQTTPHLYNLITKI